MIMPQSETVTAETGGDVAFSGLVVGAYGCGVLFSMPLFVHLAARTYRGGMLLVAAIGVLANSAYALAASGVLLGRWGLVLSRACCGVEGGQALLCVSIFYTLG